MRFSLSRLLGLAGQPGRPRPRRKATPQVEQLAARDVPACATISGHVYADANNNGVRDAGEQPIANSTIELRTPGGEVVATTTTNAQGFYEFDTDERIDTTPVETPAQTLTFSRGRTTWSRADTIEKFDPSLGTLTAIEIINSGTIYSTARVESTDAASQTVTSEINALLRLQGPGFANLDAADSSSISYVATPFDGTLDYGGTSGRNLGEREVPVSETTTITDPAALAMYTGTGTVSLTVTASGGNSVVGSSGGNLDSVINTEGEADVQVIYHYIPENCLEPGSYVIVQPNQPPNFIDGKETSGNQTPLPNTIGTDRIPVTVTTDSPENNFGEVRSTGLSGYVYRDFNDNCEKEPGEGGITGVLITLTGTDDRGQSVRLTTTTGDGGFYQFLNLRPGTYALEERQPAGFVDGCDHIGTQGGTEGNDRFTNIVLQPGQLGENNNFGELPVASVAGVVYHDVNNNGRREAGERPIGNVLITLTGTDITGKSVRKTMRTNGSGAYKFAGLTAGNYVIVETQPGGSWIDGKDTLGSHGGRVLGNDRLSLRLNGGDNGTEYNFGERLRPKQVTNPEPPRPNNPPPGTGPSKSDLLWSSYFGGR